MALIDLLNDVKREYGIDEFANMLNREPNRVLAIMSDSKSYDRSIVPLVIENMVSRGMIKAIVNNRGKENADDVVNMSIEDCVLNGIQRDLATEYIYAFADIFELKYLKNNVVQENISQITTGIKKENKLYPTEEILKKEIKPQKVSTNKKHSVRKKRRRIKAIVVCVIVIFILGIFTVLGFIYKIKEKERKGEEILARYEEGNITFEDALQQMKSIKVDITMIEQIEERREVLRESQKSFEKAEAYLKVGNYPEAIKNYSLVNIDDDNYTEAQMRIEKYKNIYVENVLKESRVAIDEGDLEQACRILEDANEKLESIKFEIEIETLKTQITDIKNANEKIRVENEILQSLAEENYKEASYLYKQQEENVSDEIKQQYHIKIDEYVRKQLQAAKVKYFESYDATEASNMVKVLENEVGSRDDISKYIMLLNSAGTLDLAHMKRTAQKSSDDSYIPNELNGRDKLGNIRSNALRFFTQTTSFVQYECAGYNQLYFVVVPAVWGWEDNVSFKVIGLYEDGSEKDIYSSPVFKVDSSFTPITIDLQGATYFKICGEKEFFASWLLFDDMCLKKILTDKDFDF